MLKRQQAFGYTQEDLRVLIAPMAINGEEPVGSMGTDTSLAVLSQRPRLLFDYFKQLFAQVTNPPLDAIREELVTDMGSTIGPERNLLKPEPESCRQIKIKYPIIHNEHVAKLRHLPPDSPFRSTTLSLLFDADKDGAGLEQAMDELCRRASEAVRAGYDILILSDRGVGPRQAPIPSLLATAGVHHHLVREGTRTRCALVVECGDAREVHHVSLLIGYGAGVVNPYVAFETIDDMILQGMLPGIDRDEAIAHYIKALNKGILKVMSKMGISTLQSYCGAQIFEAIGLNQAFIDRYFTHTTSRISGVGIDVIAEEVRLRHERAFGPRPAGPEELDGGGEYQWRRDGEYHLFNPETVFKLQHATRSGQYSIFKEYTRLVDEQNQNRATLRGLFRLKPAGPPVPIDEVEPVESILKRFSTGAMSYGSISQEAHETLAIAMNRLGGKSNTGEGGEDPERYVPDANGDSRRSAIKQVASARFGVTSEYLVNADDLQIKMAQGAKPGEGGQLPGHEGLPVDCEDAVRHAVRRADFAAAAPRHLFDRGPGAAHLRPEELEPEGAHPREARRRGRRRHRRRRRRQGAFGRRADLGPRRRHRRVAADEPQARGPAVGARARRDAAGARPEQAARSHRRAGGRPAEDRPRRRHRRAARRRGVRLRDGAARRDGLRDDARLPPEHLPGRHRHAGPGAAQEVHRQAGVRRELLPVHRAGSARADGGARLPDDRRDDRPRRLPRHRRRRSDHWKASGLDLAPLLHVPALPAIVARRRVREQDHGIDKAFDNELIERCRPALEHRRRVEFSSFIRNSDRTVGTMLGYEVTKRYGGNGLPDDTIRMTFTGSAGQSFGAFLPRGITMTLVGDANDGFGKGLSGGRLIAYPPLRSTFRTEENIIIGNVAFYGATGGEAFVSGVAGERFCVRNSGATVVVEGVGDHGCEYMTGGRALVLGRTGRNFAAGMSGGIAYVLDRDGQFERRCNLEMVDLEPLVEAEDIDFVQVALMKHVTLHGQPLRGAAARGLGRRCSDAIVKVMPREYKKALAAEANRLAARLPAIRLRRGFGGQAGRGRQDSSSTVGESAPNARLRRTISGRVSERTREFMGKVTGFIEIKRKKHPTRPVEERIHDWREVYLPYPTPSCATRARAAWTAASRSATRAARSAT